MSLRKLLVPLDYSDHSLNALRVAIELAQQFKAKLILLHSHDVSSSSSMSHYRGILEPMSHSVKEQLMEELKWTANTFKELSELEVEYRITLGPATDDIREIVKKKGSI